MLVAIVIAVAAVLFVTADWLVALALPVGIAEYNARVRSRLMVYDVGLDPLTRTATPRGVSIAERGQSSLEILNLCQNRQRQSPAVTAH